MKTTFLLLATACGIFMNSTGAHAVLPPHTPLSSLEAGTHLVFNRSYTLSGFFYQVEGMGTYVRLPLSQWPSCHFFLRLESSQAPDGDSMPIQDVTYTINSGTTLVLAERPRIHGNFLTMRFSSGIISSFHCRRLPNSSPSSGAPTVEGFLSVMDPGATFSSGAIYFENPKRER